MSNAMTMSNTMTSSISRRSLMGCGLVSSVLGLGAMASTMPAKLQAQQEQWQGWRDDYRVPPALESFLVQQWRRELHPYECVRLMAINQGQRLARLIHLRPDIVMQEAERFARQV